MKIDFSYELYNHLAKQPLREGVKYKHENSRVVLDGRGDPIEVDPGRPTTLGDVAATALQQKKEGDPELSAKEHIERFTLASKVSAGGEIELDGTDFALIQERIVKVYADHPLSNVIIGQSLLALEGKAPGPKLSSVTKAVREVAAA